MQKLQDLGKFLVFSLLSIPSAKAATDSLLRLPKNTPEAIRARIVSYAYYELGHHDRDSRNESGRYYGFGGEWCSEFVSWVYHAAGAAFQGGRHGFFQFSRIDWILETTTEIRNFFLERKGYISAQEFSDALEPRIGDYAFVRHGSWKHSAIITEAGHTADGLSYLAVISGNHRLGSRVRRDLFVGWKNQANAFGDRIAGIGLLNLEKHHP